VWIGNLGWPLSPKDSCKLNQQPSQQANLSEGCRIAEIAKPPPVSRSLRRPTPPINALTFHRSPPPPHACGIADASPVDEDGDGAFFTQLPQRRAASRQAAPRRAAREQLTRQKAPLPSSGRPPSRPCEWRISLKVDCALDTGCDMYRPRKFFADSEQMYWIRLSRYSYRGVIEQNPNFAT